MKQNKLCRLLVILALILPITIPVAHAYELVIPGLMYRTGPYAPNGIPFANGFASSVLNDQSE